MAQTASILAGKFPVVELASGVRVANFSSPHPFRFDDGTELPAVEEAVCRALSLNRQEVEHPGRVPGTTDVGISFEMTDPVREALAEAEALHSAGEVDLILVPLPVKEALRSDRGIKDATETPFRGCVLADRVTKIISSTRFAV